MSLPHVLLVDADLEAARALRPVLEQAGVVVVSGARTQQRLDRLPPIERTTGLTVPVGDVVDAEVVLTTIQDAMGPVVAVVVPVQPSEGKVSARVRPVADAMALAEGLAQAGTGAGLRLVIHGPGAAAVAAFITPAIPDASLVFATEERGDLLRAVQGGETVRVRRRDRVVASARTWAARVWPRKEP